MSLDIVIWVILLVLLVLAAFAAVVVRTISVAVILLAVTSVLLAVVLYASGMHTAAVIELSVSAGLVTAIFASAIALLKPTGDESETSKSPAARFARYVPLPIILLVLVALILFFVPSAELSLPVDAGATASATAAASAQTVLWGERTLDIVGLTLLILAGVLGVAALIRRKEKK